MSIPAGEQSARLATLAGPTAKFDRVSEPGYNHSARKESRQCLITFALAVRPQRNS